MTEGWQHLSGVVDNVMVIVMGISVTLLVGVTGVMIYFVFRYSRKRNPHPEDITGNLPLEIIWLIVPTILVLAIFWAGWKGFLYMRTVPPDAMLVKVTASMWTWSFQYENGRQSGVLKVPLRKPVKLSITSTDMLHSLFIPAFRVKEDAVPGMETYLWFLPDEVGTYDLFCTEYCGTGHADMITKVEVLPEGEFMEWYNVESEAEERQEQKTPDGAALIRERGCTACHSLDGTPKVGPTFKGIYGRATTAITGGKERSITVDEDYLSRSILEPQSDVVKGFPPIMPSQKGILSKEEIEAIIRHLKTL